MIPTPEQLDELARRREGSLQETPFSVLLFAHAVQRRTLVLELKRRQLWKKIVLEDGVPVDCRSNLAHETLGRYMVAEGKLSEEDFNAALSRSAAHGMQMGEVLLEQGLVSAVDLFKILQANLGKKLLDLFTWQEGEYRTLPDFPEGDSALKVKVPQLIVTGITKLAPQEEVDMSVGPLVGKKLVLHPSPFYSLDDIRLSASQNRLVEAIRPGRRMGELAEATGLPFDEITRLLYALCVLGVVVPSESVPTGAIPIPAAVRAGAPAMPPPTAGAQGTSGTAGTSGTGTAGAPAVPAMSQAELDRRRNEIMQAYLSYRRQDSFDLLGLPEEAPVSAVEEKFLDFSQRFAPWSLGHPDLQNMAERARDLFLAGARAFGELSDTEQRNTLIFRRKTLREERARRPAAESFAIKTDLLDSELQFKKGLALMQAGKPREAEMLLEFAADCDPTNSLYAAELAHCRVLNSPGSAITARRALKDLEETLRRDPNCGLAALYAGEIAGEIGEREVAENHLRRAIKLMSPDRRPIEALKALSTQRR
ncbi:MAG TPA: DUF4388 domain-containing protein [Thermoanaerobaculia bacterium]|nr:DUF4388 domain-containing protein [Thermoanaerobaculia bacterium]